MGDSQLTVCVAGATGFVGRHVVRTLLERGHAVRALVRDPSKASAALPEHDRLSIHRGEPAPQDGPDGLCEWAERADAMVNTIGIIREAPGGQTFARVHVGVTKALLRAAKGAGVGHFVQVSALGVHDEADTAYARSKFEGETLVRNSGLAWTILRPSLIHGPDGEFMQLAKGWATGRAAPFVFMPYFTRPVEPLKFPVPKFESAVVAPISVDDVALAVARSLERRECRGEVLHLCGPEPLTWPELLEFVRDNVTNGKKELKTLGLPGPVAAMKARAARVVGLRDALPFDEGMATNATRDSVCSMDKAAAFLGLEPVGFRATASGYLARL
ncbi:MAG: NAD(P)H-binding protein [Phycisphaeraceae bacterium]|nr:NAD(P)H-binding protein [Phycisphaeraceae bacterium]